MKQLMTTMSISILACLLVAGCSEGLPEGENKEPNPTAFAPALPTTTSPSPIASMATPPQAKEDDLSVLAVVGLKAPMPETWMAVPIESSMQNVRFQVPGPEGSDPAYLTVFHFPGTGGSADANIIRWAGQFRTDEGGPVEPIIDQFESNGLPVTLVELQGTYQGMGMPAPAPNQLFLSGIVDAPVGRVFIRLVGPAETVEANREAYMKLLHEITAS
ncbi:MAG: hypothetical protein O7G85_17220 [Planctomycetota bacterium]|nr:hypothetical protein [Planctomycetota bacterium]